MSGLQNVAICNTKGAGNTGFGSCVVDIGYIAAIWFAPDNFKIPTASITAATTGALAVINAAILNDLPAQRLYPVPGIVKLTDGTEADTIVTYPDGTKALVKEGRYALTLQFVKGAFCLSYRLRMANGLNRSFFLIDKNGRIYGTDTGDGKVTAIKPDFAWTNGFKFNDGTNPAEYSTMVEFDKTYLNDYPSFLDFKNNGGYAALLAMSGLQDVVIEKVTRSVAVINVTAKTACGTTNLFDLYGATLASGSLWVAYTDSVITPGTPGNALTIVSVASNTNAKAYTITIDTTDPDYVVGAPIWIGLAGPTETQPALLAGYESNLVSIT